MKKLLFATALLAALLLSACGGKTNDDDFMNLSLIHISEPTRP